MISRMHLGDDRNREMRALREVGEGEIPSNFKIYWPKLPEKKTAFVDTLIKKVGLIL